MKKINSFQTADGKLFTDSLEAAQHEFSLTMRGFFQSRNNLGNTGAITVTQVAETISKAFPEFKKLLDAHTRSIASIAAARTKKSRPALIPA